MGSATIGTPVSTIELGNGHRMIVSNASLSCSYATGGETFDISAYLSGSPLVLVNPSSGLPTTISHDRGTAAAGKIVLHTTSNGNLAQGYSQIASATNVATVVFNFIAIGTAV